MHLQEYQQFSSRIYEKSYGQFIPTHGHFELTFKCPLKCVFCYCTCYTSPEYTRRELSTADILRILDEAANAGCLWMTFSGGDPFIRPDFRIIYDQAQRLGMIVSIFASGLLLSSDWLTHLQQYPPFKIEIPLYGVTTDTYENVAGRRGTFQKAMSNIQNLIAAGLPLRLKTKVLSLNWSEMPQLQDFIENTLDLEFNPNYFLYPRLDHSSDHLQYRLSPGQILEFEKIFPGSQCESQTDRLTSDEINPRLFRCAAGINSFYINPYGELNFCTYVRGVSYNLCQGSLQEGIAHIRSELLSREYPTASPCHSCSIQNSCQNCPGHAYLETHSLSGRSEYLCSVNQSLRGQGIL